MMELTSAAHPGISVICMPSTVHDHMVAKLADQLWHEVHGQWATASRGEIRSHTRVAAYRHLARSLGLDPDKNPPSIQGLIDRGLRNKEPGNWPRINPVVDALNAVAVHTMTALGAFDADKIAGAVRLDVTTGGEEFTPIGGSPQKLSAGLLVLADEMRVLSLFAQRDGAHQAVTSSTTRLLLLGCAVPGVPQDAVAAALTELDHLLRRGS